MGTRSARRAPPPPSRSADRWSRAWSAAPDQTRRATELDYFCPTSPKLRKLISAAPVLAGRAGPPQVMKGSRALFARHLSLSDYRSWPTAEVPLQPGVNVLIGRNGTGKTNLVEALGIWRRCRHTGSLPMRR